MPIYNRIFSAINPIYPHKHRKKPRFLYKNRGFDYNFDDLDELMLAYAITIHKSQGSEYPICIIPIKLSHSIMLKRNLIYTAITRCKDLCIMIGEKQAFQIASNTLDNYHRKTNLNEQIIKYSKK